MVAGTADECAKDDAESEEKGKKISLSLNFSCYLDVI